jgi:hypothetical protein
MTKKQRRQLSLGWAVALVVALTALAASAGLSSAIAADDPTPTPAAGAAPAADPGAEAAATDTTSGTATATATATESATETPSETVEPTESPTVTPCPTCPPDSYKPRDGALFNHPHTPGMARTIRTHVLRTINSVPGGGYIRLAEYSLNDSTTAQALYAAHLRGVSVQIVGNIHNVTGNKVGPPSQSFLWLRSKLGASITRSGIDPERVSFTKVCHYSCRGTGGNVHYKMFLFSSAGKFDATGAEVPGQVAHNITMMGSPNLTIMASDHQWNHLQTYSGNKETYDTYWRMFQQMRADKPISGPYRDFTSITPRTWFFPRPGTTATSDPLMKGLNQIRCKGVAKGYGRNGRTFIRIGAYAWYENRGRWLAKKVRSLWNAGCDIAVEYAIMGNTVKKTLYSPSGRGRIPMRQVATFKRNGDFTSYDHAKYVTVSGNYGGDSGTYVTWAGTTNFSDLGFRADDSTQVWRTAAAFSAYSADFYRTYRERFAHVPSPTSRLPGSIGDRNITLGQGRYNALEPN